MKYKLVNISEAALQIDLFDPTRQRNNGSMRRVGPEVVLSLDKGVSADILPYFQGSLERAHASVKFSKDVLQHVANKYLHIHVCDDGNIPVDIDKLLQADGSRIVIETPVVVPIQHEDTTKPDLEISAVLAAQDQFEAVKRGEANSPVDPMPVKIAYTKYTKEDLMEMSRDDLVKLGNRRFNLKMDKFANKKKMIDTILGAQ